MGTARGLCHRRILAGRYTRRGQSHGGAVQEPQSGGDGIRGTSRGRSATRPAGAGDHRDGDAAGHRCHDGDAASVARARCRHCHGRLRYRLFVAELFAPLPVRPHQDRPVLRPRTVQQARLRCDRARRRRAEPGTRHGDDGRRRGDTRAARPAYQRRLHRSPGLSVQSRRTPVARLPDCWARSRRCCGGLSSPRCWDRSNSCSRKRARERRCIPHICHECQPNCTRLQQRELVSWTHKTRMCRSLGCASRSKR